MARNTACSAKQDAFSDDGQCVHQANWYVVQTKPHQEFRALEQLKNQGYDCYLPTLQVKKMCRGKQMLAIEPLFSRYLFMRLDTVNTDWGPIRSTRGVSSMVTFGGRFAKLPDDYVFALQRVPQPSLEKQFALSDQVTITEGPFAGLHGLYQVADGEARAFVLIELMRQPQQISFALDTLHKTH